MKKIISLLAALALVSVVAFAQEKPGKKGKMNNDAMREKVRAEQVAFITEKLNLSEADAQKFWPVYNEVQAARREAFDVQHQAMRALKKELTADNAQELLDKFEAAKKEAQKVEDNAWARYKKVLSAEQVAKLVVAEEDFRHQQIGKLGQGKGPGAGHGKGGPVRPGPAPTNLQAE